MAWRRACRSDVFDAAAGKSPLDATVHTLGGEFFGPVGQRFDGPAGRPIERAERATAVEAALFQKKPDAALNMLASMGDMMRETEIGRAHV